MRILFQGDSITDGARCTNDLHGLGCSYPHFAAELIRDRHPETEFKFINRGVSGNQTIHLLKVCSSNATAVFLPKSSKITAELYAKAIEKLI